MREDRVNARAVLRLFHFDHLVLHALGGTDQWWNLDPKLIDQHREKSRKDTGVVAKVRRIAPQWKEFTNKMARADKGQPVKKERKVSIIWQCPQCRYRIRSINKRYISIKMHQHLKGHADENG